MPLIRTTLTPRERDLVNFCTVRASCRYIAQRPERASNPTLIRANAEAIQDYLALEIFFSEA